MATKQPKAEEKVEVAELTPETTTDTPPPDETPAAAATPPAEASEAAEEVAAAPDELAALVEAVMPHVPAGFRADVTGRLRAAGCVITDWSHPETPEQQSLTRYRVTSAVNATISDHALNLHALALDPIASANGEAGGVYDICGVDIRRLYPDVSPVFASNLRQALAGLEFRSVRDLSARSAPARLTVVFQNIIRTEDYGIDGYAFETVALKRQE